MYRYFSSLIARSLLLSYLENFCKTFFSETNLAAVVIRLQLALFLSWHLQDQALTRCSYYLIWFVIQILFRRSTFPPFRASKVCLTISSLEWDINHLYFQFLCKIRVTPSFLMTVHITLVLHTPPIDMTVAIFLVLPSQQCMDRAVSQCCLALQLSRFNFRNPRISVCSWRLKGADGWRWETG